jgi:hypothetical protein
LLLAVAHQPTVKTGLTVRQVKEIVAETALALGTQAVAVELEVLAQMELVLVLQAVRV